MWLCPRKSRRAVAAWSAASERASSGTQGESGTSIGGGSASISCSGRPGWREGPPPQLTSTRDAAPGESLGGAAPAAGETAAAGGEGAEEAAEEAEPALAGVGPRREEGGGHGNSTGRPCASTGWVQTTPYL